MTRDDQSVCPDPHMAGQFEGLALHRLRFGESAYLDRERLELGGLDHGEPRVMSGRTDRGLDDGLPQRLHRIWYAYAAPEPSVLVERDEDTPMVFQELVRAFRPRREFAVARHSTFDYDGLDYLPSNRDKVCPLL